MVASDGQMFGKGGGPPMVFFQGGTLTQAYRPPIFQGTLRPSKLILAINQNTVGAAGAEVSPTGSGDVALTPAEDDMIQKDGTPFVELFDRQAGAWMRFAHFSGSTSVSIADPARYVDPTSGTVLVRFRASDQNGCRVLVPGPARGEGPVSAIVSARGLAKRYDRTLAVAGLDLDIEAGEIFGLVGPNGAGKTTILRMLATLLMPTSGDAEIGGASVRNDPTGGAPGDRVHARRLRRLRRHEGLGVPRLLRPVLRPVGGATAADDRRPARARRPRPTSGIPTSRGCHGACSSACASPTPSSTTRPSCCSTSPPRASTRGPGWSCASSCASCGRSARRS